MTTATREKQKLYWNQVAADKEFTTPFQFEAFTQLISPSAAILDVGCGYGRTLTELKNHGYTCLQGVDFSEKLIARASQICGNQPGLSFSVQKSEHLDFPDAGMDAVILFAVLTCIAENEAQVHLLTEIHRVLKPGGILYINDFLLNNDERNLTRYAEYQHSHNGPYGCFTLPPQPPHTASATLRHHAPEHIRGLVNKFVPLHVEPVVFLTMNGHTSRGFFYFGRKPL